MSRRGKPRSIVPLIEELPIKQGLKQDITDFVFGTSHYLIEELPIKQGLKPITFAYQNVIVYLIEELPIKQGLKQK